MIYCIDIDGTICNKITNQEYHKAKPFKEMIKKINKLYDEGNIIKMFTARGMGSGKDFQELTYKQLVDWGVRFHILIMGKPNADLYIDDKSMLPEEFINIGGKI